MTERPALFLAVGNTNIDTEEDPRFPECDTDFSDKNLEKDNHSSESEMYASDEEINKNNSDESSYTRKDKSQNGKKKGNYKNLQS